MRTATLLAAALLLSSPLAKAQEEAASCLTGPNILITNPNPQMKVPFTATVKATFDQKLADGDSIHGTVRYRIARDGSGRTMVEVPLNCYIGEDGHRHQTYHVTVSDRSTNTNETWSRPETRGRSRPSSTCPSRNPHPRPNWPPCALAPRPGKQRCLNGRSKI